MGLLSAPTSGLSIPMVNVQAIATALNQLLAGVSPTSVPATADGHVPARRPLKSAMYKPKSASDVDPPSTNPPYHTVESAGVDYRSSSWSARSARFPPRKPVRKSFSASDFGAYAASNGGYVPQPRTMSSTEMNSSAPASGADVRLMKRKEMFLKALYSDALSPHALPRSQVRPCCHEWPTVVADAEGRMARNIGGEMCLCCTISFTIIARPSPVRRALGGPSWRRRTPDDSLSACMLVRSMAVVFLSWGEFVCVGQAQRELGETGLLTSALFTGPSYLVVADIELYPDNERECCASVDAVSDPSTAPELPCGALTTRQTLIHPQSHLPVVRYVPFL